MQKGRNMLTNDQLSQWDRENFLHPSTHFGQHGRGESPARIVSTASGVYIEDRDGNKLLDAFAGLYCVNVGYGRTEIAEAIAAQAHELAYYHAYVGHGTEASITLAHMVAERAPAHMNRVYFGLGGSDANETNVKLVWYINNVRGRPEKRKIKCRHKISASFGKLSRRNCPTPKIYLPLLRKPPLVVLQLVKFIELP